MFWPYVDVKDPVRKYGFIPNRRQIVINCNISDLNHIHIPYNDKAYRAYTQASKSFKNRADLLFILLSSTHENLCIDISQHKTLHTNYKKK